MGLKLNFTYTPKRGDKLNRHNLPPNSVAERQTISYLQKQHPLPPVTHLTLCELLQSYAANAVYIKQSRGDFFFFIKKKGSCLRFSVI